jgi:DNA polymerase IV
MPRSERVILHADMDAFYAAVEQLDRPELRGRPVLVGGTGPRGVVSTASYEARPTGVGSAMPMAEARRRCPDAVVLPPRFDRYVEQSRRVRAVFDRFSPLVEPLSLDEAFLDMSGSEGLFGPPREMGLRIKREVFEATGGLTISVGVAPTKFVAKVASDLEKPDGLTVVAADEVLDVLWPLPVSRIWGVGPKTRERLERRGLFLIGDLARAREDDLTRLFGSLGSHIHHLARGLDPRAVVPERDEKSLGMEVTLDRDIQGAEAIAPLLRELGDKVWRRLRGKGLVAGGVRIKLKTSDFRLWTRQTLMSPPSDVGQELTRAALGLLEQVDLRPSFRLVGVAAIQLDAPRPREQLDLFAAPAPRERARKLDHALDQLHARFGDAAVVRGTRWTGGEAVTRRTGSRSPDDT